MRGPLPLAAIDRLPSLLILVHPIVVAVVLDPLSSWFGTAPPFWAAGVAIDEPLPPDCCTCPGLDDRGLEGAIEWIWEDVEGLVTRNVCVRFKTPFISPELPAASPLLPLTFDFLRPCEKITITLKSANNLFLFQYQFFLQTRLDVSLNFSEN